MLSDKRYHVSLTSVLHPVVKLKRTAFRSKHINRKNHSLKLTNTRNYHKETSLAQTHPRAPRYKEERKKKHILTLHS